MEIKHQLDELAQCVADAEAIREAVRGVPPDAFKSHPALYDSMITLYNLAQWLEYKLEEEEDED